MKEYDEKFMRRCIELSQLSVDAGNAAFGSLVARGETFIAEAQNDDNTRVSDHAEILALNKAHRALGTADLSGCTLYTSCEPCPMCAFVIRQFRISRVVFALLSPDVGGYSKWQILQVTGLTKWEPFFTTPPEVTGRFMEKEAAAVMDQTPLKMFGSQTPSMHGFATERLKLSIVTPNDLDDIHALHLLPESDRYNTLGIPENIQQTRNLLEEWLRFASQEQPQKYVFLLRDMDNDFVGIAGITIGRAKYRSAEIWYKLHPAHWNKGYATETAKAFLDFCFNDLKLHRVEAGCAVENVASVRVLEKCGFQLEGRCRKKLPIRGEWVDNFEYAILEEDYQ